MKKQVSWKTVRAFGTKRAPACRRAAVLLAATAVTAGSAAALAVNKTYFGPNFGNFATAANWSPTGVPATGVVGDDVFLGNHSAGSIDLNVTINTDLAPQIWLPPGLSIIP